MAEKNKGAIDPVAIRELISQGNLFSGFSSFAAPRSAPKVIGMPESDIRFNFLKISISGLPLYNIPEFAMRRLAATLTISLSSSFSADANETVSLLNPAFLIS